uniref:Leucine-rich repeat-containing N-terminal plant-type domain-containing protein n=1 Tax=Oryza nivara TaxID=4536 RepID=A0A0E0FP85_ORYNI
MHTLHVCCIQLAIVLFLLAQTECSNGISAHNPNETGIITRCITTERSVLLAFRAGLSDPANLLPSWEGDDCCRRKGVGCSKRTGSVIKLDLQGPGCDNSTIKQWPASAGVPVVSAQLEISQPIPLGLYRDDTTAPRWSLSTYHTTICLERYHLGINYEHSMTSHQSILVTRVFAVLLCPRVCSQTEPVPFVQKDQEDENEKVFFFLAMGIGYVLGIWTILCIFLFQRKWRAICFSFYDSMYDRVYVQVAVTWASFKFYKEKWAETN